MAKVLFLLLLFVSLLPATTPSLTLLKLCVANNPENVASVRLHADSRAMTPMHAMLRFNRPNQTNQTAATTLYPAMVIDSASFPRYSEVAVDQTPGRAPRLAMIARAQVRDFAYQQVPTIKDAAYIAEQQYAQSVIQMMATAASAAITFTANLGYDAILSLDADSSLWSQYNTAVFTRSSLTLSEEEEDWPGPETAGFDTVLSLTCAENLVASGGQCTVPLKTTSLTVSQFDIDGDGDEEDVPPPSYSLVIDLAETYNYLPSELYTRWLQLGQSGDIQLTIGQQQQQVLTLGSQYDFLVHDDAAQTIVVGADLLKFIPQLAYSTQSNVVSLAYYAQMEGSFAAHEAVAIIFMFGNIVTLLCLFIIATSANAALMSYLIQFPLLSRRTFYFAYKQVFYELLAVAIAVVEWFLVGFTGVSGAWPLGQPDQRVVLFLCVSIYHVLVLVLILCLEREPFKLALNRYLPRLYFALYRNTPQTMTKKQFEARRDRADEEANLPPPKTLDEKHARECAATIFADAGGERTKQRLYDHLVKNYHDPLCKLPFGLVLARNLSLYVIILSNLLLAYNYSAEFNSTYLLLCVAFSLVLYAYVGVYLVIGVLFVSRFTAPIRQNKLFSLYWLVEAVGLVLFVVFVTITTLLPYFEAVNSGYADTIVLVFVLMILGLLAVAAVYFPLSKVREYIDRFLDHRERELALLHTGGST